MKMIITEDGQSINPNNIEDLMVMTMSCNVNIPITVSVVACLTDSIKDEWGEDTDTTRLFSKEIDKKSIKYEYIKNMLLRRFPDLPMDLVEFISDNHDCLENTSFIRRYSGHTEISREKMKKICNNVMIAISENENEIDSKVAIDTEKAVAVAKAEAQEFINKFRAEYFE